MRNFRLINNVIFTVPVIICFAGTYFSANTKLIDKAIDKYLYHKTYEKETIDNRSWAGKNNSFDKIISNDTLLGYLYQARVRTCRIGGCDSPSNNDTLGLDSYEYFDYFIVYDKEKSIQSVQVYNYQATHGEEVCSYGWLKQFKNFKGETYLRYKKDIDAIAGATISAEAITHDINIATSALQQIN